jgi:hypothetical protein
MTEIKSVLVAWAQEKSRRLRHGKAPWRPFAPFRCSLCGATFRRLQRGHCPHCNAPARLRSLPVLFDRYLSSRVALTAQSTCPLLAFAMTTTERKVLAPIYSRITSVSLYGSYGEGHIGGVDVCDLSCFADGGFRGVFSILLFDYVLEQEKGLIECFRVTEPGGLLFTHIASHRLTEDEMPPKILSLIVRRDDYFNYLPEDAKIYSVAVGRRWFLRTMEQVGFETQHIPIWDDATSSVSHWFVGVKPG